MRFTSVRGAAATGALALAAVVAACGQDGVVLPEGGGGTVAECGPWYPSGIDGDEGDAGVPEFGANLSETLPCFVWESVRAGAQEGGADPATYANAYLSMGELHLKAEKAAMQPLLEQQFGVSEAKIALFVIAAENCGTCWRLMEGVTNSKAELLAAGVVPIGVASFDSSSYDEAAMDLVAADDVMIGDGLDEGFYRTNDPEHYVGERASFEGFPYLIAVRVEDMAVAIRSYPDFYYNGAGDGIDVAKLVADVEAFVPL
jgi:hypothetical protein